MNKKTVGFLGLLFVIIAGLAIVFFLFGQNIRNSTSEKESGKLSETADRLSYTPEGMGFTIEHPSDLVTDIDIDGYAQLYKEGPTQQPGTELRDGISLRIRPEPLQGKTLQEVVESELANLTVASVIEDPKAIKINGIDGIRYTIEEVGVHRHILLFHADGDSYLHIIDSTIDPGNLGFAGVVEEMLASLKLQAQQLTLQNKIFLVAIEDNGRLGPEIGCNDSLVSVPVEIEQDAPVDVQIRALYRELLKIDTRTYGEDDFYNALFESDLIVGSVSVLDDTATIYLTGTITSGGVCDDPRIEKQLEAIALQFPQINIVRININGTSISELLVQE